MFAGKTATHTFLTGDAVLERFDLFFVRGWGGVAGRGGEGKGVGRRGGVGGRGKGGGRDDVCDGGGSRGGLVFEWWRCLWVWLSHGKGEEASSGIDVRKVEGVRLLAGG